MLKYIQSKVNYFKKKKIRNLIAGITVFLIVITTIIRKCFQSNILDSSSLNYDDVSSNLNRKLIDKNTKGFFESKYRELLVFGAATQITDGLVKYKRSLQTYGLKVKVLGLNQKFTGFSLKVRLLREQVEYYKERDDVIVLFSDSYDVIFTGGKKKILKVFDNLNASIVFSAESNCWPLKKMVDEYPEVGHGYRFLNSGGFIGYANSIYKLLPPKIEVSFDDQLFYSKIYVNESLRTSLNIVLDSNALLFQSCYNVIDHLELRFKEDDSYLFNKYTNTSPLVIHGNGNSKFHLHALSDYLAKSWVEGKGCLSCSENRFNISSLPVTEYPEVIIGVFIERPTSFLKIKLQAIQLLTFPKHRISLKVHNLIYEHENEVANWVDDIRRTSTYKAIEYYSSSRYNQVHPEDRKNQVVDECLISNCSYVLFMDSEVVIENMDLVQILISYNKSLIAPMMNRRDKEENNLIRKIEGQNRLVDNFDNKDIFHRKKKGLWSVFQLEHIYMLQKEYLQKKDLRPYFNLKNQTMDQSISTSVRTNKRNSMFLYGLNMDYYGHLTNDDKAATGHLHNDLWQSSSNFQLWSQQYIHPLYQRVISNISAVETPCPGVFWIPIFTKEFCNQLLETVEHFNKGSTGSHKDLRLHSQKEQVPSSDIYFEKFGFDQEWKVIHDKIISPIIKRLFNFYENTSPNTFIVRYDRLNHRFLNAHKDSSKYSINVSLNSREIDYKGGGTQFLSSKCSVEHPRVGWALVHRGDLPHQGLPINQGKRFILVSFLN